MSRPTCHLETFQDSIGYPGILSIQGPMYHLGTSQDRLGILGYLVLKVPRQTYVPSGDIPG